MLAGTGGYAEKAVAPEHSVFEVPGGLDDGAALALLIQGLTAWHLLRTSARLRPGESVVVQSATGGTGGMALQLARIFGAGRVIATAGSPERREQALAAGADAAVDPEAEDLTAALIEANGGEPLDVILEATAVGSSRRAWRRWRRSVASWPTASPRASRWRSARAGCSSTAGRWWASGSATAWAAAT